MDKTRQEATSIEALEEILGSLRITEEYILNKNKIIEIALENMLTVPVSEVHNKKMQAVMPKSMVPDPE